MWPEVIPELNLSSGGCEQREDIDQSFDFTVASRKPKYTAVEETHPKPMKTQDHILNGLPNK